MVRLKKGEYYFEYFPLNKKTYIVKYIGDNCVYLVYGRGTKNYPFGVLPHALYTHIPKDMLLIEMEILARKEHENRTK